MIKGLSLLTAAGIVAGLISNPANAAQYPPSVLGYWALTANAAFSVALSIKSEGAIAPCQSIGGLMDQDVMQGYYCPATGEISMLRIRAGTAFQVFNGQLAATNLSDQWMAGDFVGFAPGDDSGDFSFSGAYVYLKPPFPILLK
jgi:hypothetical protein